MARIDSTLIGAAIGCGPFDVWCNMASTRYVCHGLDNRWTIKLTGEWMLEWGVFFSSENCWPGSQLICWPNSLKDCWIADVLIQLV